MNPADHTFEDIKVGDTATFTHSFSKEDVETFATLSGDRNPLHTDEAYAATTQFGKPILHGMLTASLCSTMVGMCLPGKRCLYLSQALSFKKPVYPGEELTVTGTVTDRSEVTRILSIAIEVAKGDDVALTGLAQVQVLP